MMMSTPGWMSGLPALPMAGDAAVLDPDVGLDDAPVIEISALVMTVSTAPCAR
jgi:hypothetical protein